MRKKYIPLLLGLVCILLSACGGNSNTPSEQDLANALSKINISNPKLVSKAQCEVPEERKAAGVSDVWYLAYSTNSVSEGRIFLEKNNGSWTILNPLKLTGPMPTCTLMK